MTGTNPLNSLNNMFVNMSNGNSFGMYSGVTPADMGMGLFNMPVYPQQFLGNTGALFNPDNTLLQSSSPFGTFDMSNMNQQLGSFFEVMMQMQEEYMQNLKNLMAKNMGDALYTRQGEYSDLDTQGRSKSAEELQAKWAKKKPHLSAGFYNKVVNISSRLNCSPDALMALMNSESGISTTARNKHGGATGLIQFMPSTAKSLGTSTTELQYMSAEEQLVYVEKYLQRAKRSAGFKDSDKIDAGTWYALVFLPARARRDVLTQAGEIYYDNGSNSALGSNNQITKADLARRLEKFSA